MFGRIAAPKGLAQPLRWLVSAVDIVTAPFSALHVN